MKKKNLYQFFNAKGLFLILILAFVIRIGFFVSLQPWNKEVVHEKIIVSDAAGYHRLALSLLSNKSFEDFDGFRVPGYPLFIALIYSVTNNSVWAVLLFQIFLNLVSVFLVFKITSVFFNRKIALLSAFLFAIDIHQALYAVTLLSDSLFVFLFLASVYFLVRGIKENSFLFIGLSAFVLGISTLERPAPMFIPIVIILFIFMLNNLKIKVKWIYSLIFGLLFITTISPWLLRNYKMYGVAKLTNQTGSNLLFCNVAQTEAYKTGKTYVQVKQEFRRLAVKQGIDTTRRDSFYNSQIYVNIAKQYINDNFILYVKRHFMGIINMYVGLATKHIASTFHLKSHDLTVGQESGPNIFVRVVDFFKSKTTGEILIGIYLLVYMLVNYLFALYAVFYLIRQNRKFVFLFIFIILYFTLITGVVGNTRLRLPIMPFINILSAVGLFYFYYKVLHRFSLIRS